MTEAEIDELFRATQPIGNAINALAQAELIVAAADGVPVDMQARLDETRTIIDDKENP
ncbi:hypothetical protein [Gordonia sihwensis]|uniref:hypothetical protein n=1 Tax=Gordonia sihwensis TaxID=173559 RepID=UPI000AB99495|nr:hypothetical protein [Gordonia sihwensis]